MDKKDIRIAAWNANGIQQNQNEIQLFLDMQKIDICLISETHLTKQSYIQFKGYKTYHTIHPQNSARGGSAVIVKENIIHYEQTKYETEEIQATAVKVITGGHNIKIAQIYCSPRHNLKKEDYSNMLQNLGERFIIGGDFNAKNLMWGSRLTTTKGRELQKAIDERNCTVHSTGKPTYWPTDPNKIPDLIDFFISRKISANFINIEENFELSADHSSMILTLSENVIKKQCYPMLTNKYTDWEVFREELSNKVQINVPLRNKEQLDREAEKLVVDIQQAAWKSTPEFKMKTIGNNYPKEIKELVAAKRRARKKWQQTRAPIDKNRLNQLTQQLRREIQEIKNESINFYLKNLSNDKDTDYSLWKATKKIKRPITQMPPIRTENGWAKDNKQKADAFASHLEKIFQANEQQIQNELLQAEAEREDEEIKLVTPREVAKEIKENINPRKAPGFDLITGEVLKQLPRKGIVKLTNLINAAFRLKHVPSIWKVAEVIMIQKPGKPPNETTSYRPISLLPIISKLFEKLFLKRLKPIIERKALIPTHQFGFRNQHSTVDQVHRIISNIERSLEEKKVCSAIFLDVAQAFDKVWHQGLNHKLEKNLPRQFSELLKSYIADRLFRIKQEDAYSDLYEIKAGVPQGSVLGPILYLLYTNDIPTTNQATIATFADDTAILAVGEGTEETTELLQQAINEIDTWTKRWRIKLNESKSVHINFMNKKDEYVPVTLNNSILPHANTAKYLGMNLDAKLRWKEHIKKKREELNIKYRKMYWLLGRKSQLSIHNKILLYNQVIKPVWTYGCQLWGCASKSNINKIQTFQNKVLRNIVSAPWYARNRDIHRDLGIKTVLEEIKNIAQKHETRLHEHVNVEAIQLLDNAELVRRLKRIKPFELV